MQVRFDSYVLLKVFSLASFEDLCKAAQVNRHWRALLSDPEFWARRGIPRAVSLPTDALLLLRSLEKTCRAADGQFSLSNIYTLQEANTPLNRFFEWAPKEYHVGSVLSGLPPHISEQALTQLRQKNDSAESFFVDLDRGQPPPHVLALRVDYFDTPIDFSDLTSLTHLAIKTPRSTMTGLENLTSLKAVKVSAFNTNTRFPPQFFKLSTLQTVVNLNWRSWPEIDPIPREIKSLTNLTVFKWTGCGLHTLPDELSLLTQLQELDLHDNNLPALPSVAILSLPRLKNLNLHNNLLTNMEAIVSLRVIETLNVSCNRITAVPEGIGNLRQLKWLDFSFNNITQLPSAIFPLVEKRVINSLQKNIHIWYNLFK